MSTILITDKDGATKTAALVTATGQTTASESLPVVIASDQTAVPVSAAALPLPSGAATSAAQTTANASLSSIDGKLPALATGRVPVDGSGVTQPVSAAALPLPSGAATSAAQTTGNASLSSIDGKLPALSGGRVPVTLLAAGTPGSTAPTTADLVGGTDGANLRAFSTDTSGRQVVVGAAAAGAAVAGNPVLAAGSDGTNARTIAVNTAGQQVMVPATYTATDKSGTVTTGGTAQTAIASNAARRGWMLSNVSDTLMYVRDDGTAATATTGVPVYPGQTIDDGGKCSTANISVLCATTGKAWSAKEYT